MRNLKVCFSILKKNLLPLLVSLILPLIILPIQLNSFDDTNQGFVNSKPNVYIVNDDKENDLTEDEKKNLIKKNNEDKKSEIKNTEEIEEIKVKDEEKNITKNFLKYLYTKMTIKEFSQQGKELENIIDDSLYLDKISMVIYIPENFREDIINKRNPEIKVKSNNFRSADLSKMIIDKYMRNLELLNKGEITEEELIKKVEEISEKQIKTEIFKKSKSVAIQKSEFVFSFATYSIISAVLTIDLIILYYFNLASIRKRIDVSSEKKKAHKLKVFLSMIAVTSIILLIYIAAIYIYINIDVSKSLRGLYYGLNAFIFGTSIMSLAYFLSKFIKTIGGATGITVVIALTLAFLSGAFVPRELLPDLTIEISKFFPSHYYINNVILISDTVDFSKEVLKEIFVNLGYMWIFMGVFTFFAILFRNYGDIKENKITTM